MAEGREAHEGGDICIMMADLHCCTAETNTTAGASVRNSARGKGHEEGGFGIRKGGIQPQETPCSRASTPKPESAYFTASCSHLHLRLYGGPSPTSLGEGVNLQLQLIKIPGRDKCLRSNLSAGRLACVTGLSTLLGYMIVYNLSTINSTESLEYFESLS